MKEAESRPDPVQADDGAGDGRPGGRRMLALSTAALGVVFGDIGTSPLYALQTTFSIDGGAIKPVRGDVYGVISLVFWAITVVVTCKYVIFVLRADNDGEGGVMALAALVRKLGGRLRRGLGALVLLGVFGAALFYGDSVITPAISVLSAVEGLEVAAPALRHLVLPIAVVILSVLFISQRWGTARVGRLFGPIMIVWFASLIALGLPEIVREPQILSALSPTWIGAFVLAHPMETFVALGAVVLAITGAEALYADIGHFGPAPVRLSWLALVFPALVINYLGQGGLILRSPAAVANPFYLLAPHWARWPLVVLATVATVIASQAVISGAYSVSRQAVRLGYLPHLRIRQTSETAEGQIYVPVVNWILFAGVLVLILAFRSSSRLATAYGVAVTATFLITSTLFLLVARLRRHWAIWRVVAFAVIIGGTELAFFAANLTKIVEGGWLPLLIALAVLTVMTTWRRGRQIVARRRRQEEGRLPDFVARIAADDVRRVPGTAVFLHPSKDTTPLALKVNVEINRIRHEHVVVVSVVSEEVPHVSPADRAQIDSLGDPDDGIVHVALRFGFQDTEDVPAALAELSEGNDEVELDPERTSYLISRMVLVPTSRPGRKATSARDRSERMAGWRRSLFVAMYRNAPSQTEFFRLPAEKTLEVGHRLDL